jgi:hypothetical protein
MALYTHASVHIVNANYRREKMYQHVHFIYINERFYLSLKERILKTSRIKEDCNHAIIKETSQGQESIIHWFTKLFLKFSCSSLYFDIIEGVCMLRTDNLLYISILNCEYFNGFQFHGNITIRSIESISLPVLCNCSINKINYALTLYNQMVFFFLTTLIKQNFWLKALRYRRDTKL